MREYIVIAFTENHIGVLNRITAHYLRRKINIESLKVSESSLKGISMFVITAYSTGETMQKLVRQLRNIIEVIEVEFYDQDELITQEIALYKISSRMFRDATRVDSLTRQWGARLVELSAGYVVMEKTGTREDVEQLRRELDGQGVLIEFTRSGSVVLHRDTVADRLGEKFVE